MEVIPEILEEFEEAGLSREDAEEIVARKIEELSPEQRREELDFLGKSLRLVIKPTSGSVNTEFTFTVSGHNPKKEVKIHVLKGRTRYWDPVIGVIPAGTNSIKIKGGEITPHIEWIMTKFSPSIKAQMYASQKGWIFHKKSDTVLLTIQKPPPAVPHFPIPGSEYGITTESFMPAPPPYPPIPRVIMDMILKILGKKK